MSGLHLESCPFCDKDNAYILRDKERVKIGDRLDPIDTIRVCCPDCGASVYSLTSVDDACAKWNRRDGTTTPRITETGLIGHPERYTVFGYSLNYLAGLAHILGDKGVSPNDFENWGRDLHKGYEDGMAMASEWFDRAIKESISLKLPKK